MISSASLGAAPALSILNRSFENPASLTEDAPRRRQAAGKEEPGLADWVQAAAEGQTHVVLDGRIESEKQGNLRMAFETIPDASRSKFTLNLFGSKSGLLANSSNLCRARQIEIEKNGAQKSKLANSNAVIDYPCRVKAKKQPSRPALSSMVVG